MKRSKLQSTVEYDFELLGITAQSPGYKLAWHINKALEVDLARCADQEINFSGNLRLIIANFLYETENSTLRLIENRSLETSHGTNAYLVPELSDFDFILLLQGFEDTFSLQHVATRTKEISFVQFVKAFQAAQLKSRDNLIF
jgi:hypothetical protein